ncbi:ATP-binding protein [Mesorhizobium sp. 1B3]|uniref:ATP-binding protein n=1 Tax=Mesorhizobium sp. 1B3 TaxID=3243599 RepID=UPI003D99BA44
MSQTITYGRILEEFLNMRIKHPRLDDAYALYDDLRHVKRSCPHEPQRFGALFADPQSGKSTCVKMYIESRVVDDAIERGLFPGSMDRRIVAKQQRLALHVTLSTNATPKSLATDILTAFGDPRASYGTAQSLLQRAYGYMQHFGTEIVFIDEIQHLAHKTARVDGKAERSNLLESTATTDTLKTMLLNGLVPMMFVGVREARHHLFNDPQLAARCISELDFGRLTFDNPKSRNIFIEYCGRLGIKLQQHGLFSKASDLVSGAIPGNINEVAGGRLGMASNLVLAACKVAVEEGAPCVTWNHLDEATEDWAIPMGITSRNPFRRQR